LIEQYFRPAIGVPPEIQVKHPSVKLKVAPEPPQLDVAETRLVGKTLYAPGSDTDPMVLTLPFLIVAVNVAGVLLVP
jgi:hypothetical protein